MVETVTRDGAEISLYVHVPFCRHRCGYCNFSLVAGKDHLIDRFLNSIAAEVDRIDHVDGPIAVSTIFIGGGTPSHLSSSQFKRLIEILKTKFSWTASAEFTAECNPTDLSAEKCETFKEVGVNRLSLGIQSFADSKLEFLQRDHRIRQITESISLARTVTDNISFDLIFATPEESISDWTHELDTAIEFEPQHLSTYELTIEKGTQFWNREHHGLLVVPDEQRRLDLYLTCLLYTSPSPRDQRGSRMPSSA